MEPISHTLLRLVVDLFLWLQTQDNSASRTYCRLLQCDSRLVISAEPAHYNRVESPPRHVCHSPQHDASSPVYVSIYLLAIDALSQDWLGRLMYMFPPFPLLSKVIQKLRTTQEGEVILVAPSWPTQLWFAHLLHMSKCGPPTLLSVSLGPAVTTGIYLERQSRTICMHGGSHAALPSSRIFERGL